MLPEYLSMTGLPHMVYRSGCWWIMYVLQFAGKVFDATCNTLEAKLKTAAAYRLLANGHIKWYSMTIVSRGFNYIEEHQHELNIFVSPRAFADDAQTHSTANETSFNPMLTKKPLAASGTPRPSPRSLPGMPMAVTNGEYKSRLRMATTLQTITNDGNLVTDIQDDCKRWVSAVEVMTSTNTSCRADD